MPLHMSALFGIRTSPCTHRQEWGSQILGRLLPIGAHAIGRRNQGEGRDGVLGNMQQDVVIKVRAEMVTDSCQNAQTGGGAGERAGMR